MQIRRPVPVEDEDSRPYWEAARQHRLELPRCDGCGMFSFPPRPRCPRCLSPALTWTVLSGRGRVYTFTVIHVPVVRGFETPYVVAQIEPAEQPDLRLTANILDCSPAEVYVGMPVEAVFEDLDGDCSLPQFRPAAG